MFIFAAPLPAQAEDADNDSPGYDENTEITIKGSILQTSLYHRGPVVLLVKSETKTYQVITAPRWYLAQQGIEFLAGDKIEVTGSKFYSKDGMISLIAHTIKFAGKTTVLTLRDGSCRPIWRHHHGFR
jgi:hypothetical protein